MTQTNSKIREALAISRVTVEELSDMMGVSSRTMFRQLRKEMPEDRQREILGKISASVQERCKTLTQEAQHETDTESA